LGGFVFVMSKQCRHACWSALLVISILLPVAIGFYYYNVSSFKGVIIVSIFSEALACFTISFLDSIEEYYFKDDKDYENFLNDNS
jgi:hypothetical protein